jgi:acetyl esterase/lipase
VGYDFDPDLAPWVPRLSSIDYADLVAARATLKVLAAHQPIYCPDKPVDVADKMIPGPPGAPAVTLRIYRPDGLAGPLPGLIYLHWGGFVFGDLDTTHSTATRIADQVGAVVVSVDYRLAPENPFPAGLEDCYTGMMWVAQHADELGIDLDRIGVGGESAGGGLAAALALLARDRGGPQLRFQCLVYPQLDDRLDTMSARSFVDTPKWCRASALLSWSYYLGSAVEPGGNGVSRYAAPARAENFSGLPPAFVSVCQFDPLRDEGIAYAYQLMQAGVRTELCHYPGTFHASISFAEAVISQKMVADQLDALRRSLN